jgi:hypothetical protein
MDDGLNIQEWELWAFFGSEHTSRAYGDEWYDSDSVYEKVFDNDLKLTFAIHPIHNDVRIQTVVGMQVVFDWHGVGLKEISYIEESKKTFIRLRGFKGQLLDLEVTPQLKITEHVSELDT